ncbi:MAG: acyltransferase [Mycobacterium sp.]
MSITTELAVFVHPTALCESRDVGPGTRIWAFAHIMSDATVGGDCNICDHTFVESGARNGNRVTIKNGVLIWRGVTIEDDVFCGPGMIFTNDRYPRSARMPEVSARYERTEDWLMPTTIRRGASIGAGAIILCGITVGRHASVAAGAVVTRDVPAYGLAVGNPARIAGWVCLCGRRLDEALTCPRCGRGYRFHDGTIEPAD